MDRRQAADLLGFVADTYRRAQSDDPGERGKALATLDLVAECYAVLASPDQEPEPEDQGPGRAAEGRDQDGTPLEG